MRPKSADEDPSAVTVLDHFSLTAVHHDSAVSFYGDAMGMETLPLGTGANGAHQVSYLAMGQGVLEIHSYAAPQVLSLIGSNDVRRKQRTGLTPHKGKAPSS